MNAEQIRDLLHTKASALVRRAPEEMLVLLDTDFVYLNARGVRFERNGYVDAYCRSGELVFISQDFRDLEVRSSCGFATATLFIDDVFAFGDETVKGRYRSLCVFREREHRWLWLAGQTMSLG